ncbi:phage tail tape measure protein [Shimia aestuarii]|uniref:Phage tail tape measure protein, lambda family n=1 Tax=Shimia aestuarii TaxID=254406 RepID=A0A1I4N5V2_9RHOB|nr:phage tail tape measure protein, lambda family [Shimia aestuarii]
MNERTASYHQVVLDIDADQVKRTIRDTNRQIANFTAQFDRAEVEAKKFTRATTNTNRALKSNGRFAQQAGVQMGDFLVQIGNNQNVLVSASQQLNQMSYLLSGPWGIAFTVATGVLAAFGTQILKTDEGLNAFKKTLEETRQATRDLERATQRIQWSITPEQQAALDNYTKALEELRKVEERLTTGVGGARGQALEDLRLKTAQDRVKAAEEAVIALNAQTAAHERAVPFVEAISNQIANWYDWLRGAADEAGRLADELSLGAGYYTAATRSGIVSGDVPPWAAGDLPPTAGELAWERILEGRRRAARQTDTSTGGGGATGADNLVSDVEKVIDKLIEAERQADQFGESLDVALGGVASSALDDFVDGLVTGELAFKDFARSVLNDLAKIMVRAIIVNSLMSAFGGIPGNPTNTMQSIIQGLAGIQRFGKGGIVNGPTLFPMSGGAGLMGEAGPEAIVPLQRDGSGNLGVGASPVVIHNYTGAQVQVEDREGERHVIIGQALEAVRNDFSKSMASGQGTFARALEAGYPVRRKAT